MVQLLPAPEKGKFTFIDLFAGIGGIRLGYQSLGGGVLVLVRVGYGDRKDTFIKSGGRR